MNPFTSAVAASNQTPDSADIQRKQQLAQLLMSQGMAPDAGTQMVGNVAIRRSPTEGLAKLLQSYQGRKLNDEVDADRRQVQNQGVQDVGRFIDALKGTPAEPAHDLPADVQGPVSPAQPATPGDPNRALQIALASQNPMLQQAGGGLLQGTVNASLPKTPSMKLVNRPDGKGGETVGYVNENAPNPWATFQEGGVKPAKLEFVNGTATNAYTTTPGTVIPEQLKPDSVVTRDPVTGALIPNAPVVQAKKDIATAGAARTSNTVSVAAPENEYNKVVGKGLGEDNLALVNIAKAAPEVVRNAQSIRAALANGAITGTGADSRLGITKALETAGLIGPGKAASTQALMAGMAKLTLGGVKTSGLGAGNGFTDKDREFLSSAISGAISDTPENIRRVADLSETIARANHAKGASVLQRWKSDPALKNVAQDTALDALPGGAKFLGFE